MEPAVCGNGLSPHIGLKIISSIRLSRFKLLHVSKIHIYAAGETYTQRFQTRMINGRISADIPSRKLLKAPIEAAIRYWGFESAIPDNGIIHGRRNGPARRSERFVPDALRVVGAILSNQFVQQRKCP